MMECLNALGLYGICTLALFLTVPCGLALAQAPLPPVPNDGKSDVTESLQALINQTAQTGGEVFLPPGQYWIAGSLTLPTGVTLRGSWEAPHHGAYTKGTTLLATAGRGSEEGPAFIEMRQSSALKGVTLLYPEQRSDNIQPYPWTIHGKEMHTTIEDVTLVNSYNGIAMGPESNELHLIRNVFGCVLRRGILVDNCTDIGRIENVHFNPHYWQRSGVVAPGEQFAWEKVIEFQKQNLEGFIFGKTDWEFVSNCFVIFPKVGFHFVSLTNGPGNVVVTQSGSDIGPCAVFVEESQPHAGIQFANCQFMANITIGPKNTGPVKLSNCGFWPIESTESQAVLEGQGTTIFNACHFADWGKANKKAPCIVARNGQITVSSCDFASHKPHLLLEKDVQSAVIFGNQFKDKARIENNCKRDVQIGFNANYP